MTLNKKIDFLINELKKSYLVIYNGTICIFNEHESSPYMVCLDDSTGDDYYASVNLTDIKEIYLIDGTFEIVYNDGKKTFLQIAEIKKINFE